jgi:dGTPase
VKNDFYGAFDTEVCGRARKPDYRTPFQIDRDRIIHSAAFRKLQSKTQVFLSGEFDFYRTRLTHSLEVAQIGRSICHYVRAADDSPLRDDFFIDSDLVEAVCLSHDLGHPPFGHGGERKLHELMRAHGGFEGNAQTLRLLTDILWTSDARGSTGMAPTRAFLDGVLKYKTLFPEDPQAENHFIYGEQVAYRAFAFGSDSLPADLPPGPALNKFRSIECQIMDWADDTAYSLHDISDGVRAGFLTFEKIERWADQQHPDWRERTDSDAHRWVRGLEEAIKRDALDQMVGAKIGACVRACRLAPWTNPMAARTNRYAFRLEIDPAVGSEIAFYKAMAFDIIFCSPQLYQMEHKGRAILQDLFETFLDNYLPGNAHPVHVLPPTIARLF